MDGMIHLQAEVHPELRFLEVNCMKSTSFCGSMQKALEEHSHFQWFWNQEGSTNQQSLNRERKHRDVNRGKGQEKRLPTRTRRATRINIKDTSEASSFLEDTFVSNNSFLKYT